MEKQDHTLYGVALGNMRNSIECVKFPIRRLNFGPNPHIVIGYFCPALGHMLVGQDPDEITDGYFKD